MPALKERLIHWGEQFDAAMERYIFHHRCLGFLMVFIGMPLVTLAAVCICSTLIVLPIAWLWGLI